MRRFHDPAGVRPRLAITGLVLGLALGRGALAGAAERAPLAYGISERFAAAQELVVLAVQQAISDLPPSSGQTYAFRYDPALDAYVRSDRLGPTSFFAPETVGDGVLDVRVATSFFELDASFTPIDYEVLTAGQVAYTKAGLTVGARVGVIAVGATYGLLPDLDLTVTFPVTIVDASAAVSFTTCKPEFDPIDCGTEPNPPLADARVVAVRRRERIDDPAFLRGEDPRIYQRSGSATAFAASGRAVSFTEGTQVGLGRVTVGAKKSFRAWSILSAALYGQIALPSPSQEELAGADSTALMARAISALELVPEWLRLLVDAGYELDTERSALTRFVWDLGAALTLARATFDAGFGGSVYASPLAWTPGTAEAFDPTTGEASILRALEPNTTGTTYAAFRGGFRVALTESVTLSGTTSVPVTEDTVSPDAVGTIALDVTF